MGVYASLNKFVGSYDVVDAKELHKLRKSLTNVPVNLDGLKEEVACGPLELFCSSDLQSRAKLIQPEMRIMLLDQLVEYDEACDIGENMVLPYPVILMSGIGISDNFFERTRGQLGELVLPDSRDKTARVLSDPKIPAVALVYERNERFHYLEMRLVDEML